MIHGKYLSHALMAASLLLPSACLVAQSTPPAPAEHPHEMRKPTNLQVLPKGISTKDLMATMHEFTGGLGVHCAFCHAENDQTHRLDFASDAKPEKAAARIMLQMTENLNAKYLTELPDHGEMMKVSCGTCHRGQSVPAEFTPAPEQHGPPAPAK